MIAPLLDAPDVTLITGATGWFGTALLGALCGDGEWSRQGRIRALVSSTDDVQRLSAMAGGRTTIEPVVGDIGSDAGVAALFDGVDGSVDVIHAAGVIHPKRLAMFEEVNSVGTRRLARFAHASGVRRFVHISSNSPFGTNPEPTARFQQVEPFRPYLEYGRTKMEAELHILDAVEAGLNAVIVRPMWFYGPHQPARQNKFFSMIRTGRFPLIGSGRQRRSLTYVDDLVQAVIRAELVPTNPGLGWWVADAHPYEMGEIVGAVTQALRRAGYEVAAPRLHLPDQVGRLAERADRALQSFGRYQQQLHVLGELNKTIACSIDATTTQLGFEPSVGLTEGMYRSVQWCRDAGYRL